MGIFSRWFKKEIKLDEKNASDIVVPQKLKGGKLKIDSTINVPDGYVFILGYKGKVYDMIMPGTHKVVYTLIPECTKKFKLGKPEKNGKLPTSFDINGYYVKMCNTVFEFKTYRKMELSSEKYGIYKATAKGNCTFFVENPKLFLQCLLLEYDYIKKNEASKILKDWLVEFETTAIEKQNFDTELIMQKHPSINQIMGEQTFKKFEKYGLNVQRFEINEFQLPKKFNELPINFEKVDAYTTQQKSFDFEQARTNKQSPFATQNQNYETNQAQQPQNGWVPDETTYGWFESDHEQNLKDMEQTYNQNTQNVVTPQNEQQNQTLEQQYAEAQQQYNKDMQTYLQQYGQYTTVQQPTQQVPTNRQVPVQPQPYVAPEQTQNYQQPQYNQQIQPNQTPVQPQYNQQTYQPETPANNIQPSQQEQSVWGGIDDVNSAIDEKAKKQKKQGPKRFVDLSLQDIYKEEDDKE